MSVAVIVFNYILTIYIKTAFKRTNFSRRRGANLEFTCHANSVPLSGALATSVQLSGLATSLPLSWALPASVPLSRVLATSVPLSGALAASVPLSGELANSEPLSAALGNFRDRKVSRFQTSSALYVWLPPSSRQQINLRPEHRGRNLIVWQVILAHFRGAAVHREARAYASRSSLKEW